MKRTSFLLLLLAAACSSQGKPTAPPPAPAPAMTPTPGTLSRIDPNVVEETDTYIIRRLPKDKYNRVDDRHVKDPIIPKPVEFFKEDDKYYYVSVPKAIPEESALKKQAPQGTVGSQAPAPGGNGRPLSTGVTAADFADLSPGRVSGRLRLQKVASSGLPEKGLWRASFVVLDVNGDGIPDIVAPAERLGEGKPHVWIGDRKGGFAPWKLSITENGKPQDRFSIDYGGVAVGDIDGDGHMDIVCASHGGGLVVLFGDGNGGFDVARAGLPKRDFSAQAVTLVDANGDGRLDIVASRDSSETTTAGDVDLMQVRVYIFLSRQKGWELKKDGIVGGFYSNTLHSWDYDGDGRKDVLTGSHYTGALTLLWKNAGDGTFSPVRFDAIEPYAYHFGTAPGTFGKGRAAAFVDGYSMQANVPEPMRSSGATLYVFDNGEWSRHRVWRRKDFNAYLFAIAMGDLDGDGLDDIVLADGQARRLRVFFQQPDGGFVEAAESEEPVLDSPGQCVRLADLNGDGRLDLVLSKTVSSKDPRDPGGWDVYLNLK